MAEFNDEAMSTMVQFDLELNNGGGQWGGDPCLIGCDFGDELR